ncbi:MAG TPA: HAD hydrolase-like protein [Pseudonocardiaceae bacterium]|nr:HAD hydrolase-like protein [Pseudonocardiaceae bacterium]
MRDVKHIVWDWNGTILDDNDAVVRAVNQVCARFDREPIDLDTWRTIYRRPLGDCYADLLGRPVSASDWALIDRVYHQEYDGLLDTCRLATGVPDELRRWQASGRAQSLLSMWFHDRLVPLVDEYALTDLFARIDGLRAVVGGGSKTEHLAEHLAAQGLAGADVLVIGDVTDDADAAAHVGAQCVLVTTGVMNRAQLATRGVPVVESIAEALALLP